MKVLENAMLARIAGGETDESPMNDFNGGDFGGGDMSGVDFLEGPAGSGGSLAAATPAPAPANTVFGFTMTEAGSLTAGIGAGAASASVLDAAGGWGAINTFGAAGVGLGGAYLTGLGASGLVGWNFGSAIYDHSENVQDYSQKLIGNLFQLAEDLKQDWSDLTGGDRKPQPVYHP